MNPRSSTARQAIAQYNRGQISPVQLHLSLFRAQSWTLEKRRLRKIKLNRYGGPLELEAIKRHPCLWTDLHMMGPTQQRVLRAPLAEEIWFIGPRSDRSHGSQNVPGTRSRTQYAC